MQRVTMTFEPKYSISRHLTRLPGRLSSAFMTSAGSTASFVTDGSGSGASAPFADESPPGTAAHPATRHATATPQNRIDRHIEVLLENRTIPTIAPSRMAVHGPCAPRVAAAQVPLLEHSE